MKNINWYIVEMVERNFFLEWHKPAKSLPKLKLKRDVQKWLDQATNI